MHARPGLSHPAPSPAQGPNSSQWHSPLGHGRGLWGPLSASRRSRDKSRDWGWRETERVGVQEGGETLSCWQFVVGAGASGNWGRGFGKAQPQLPLPPRPASLSSFSSVFLLLTFLRLCPVPTRHGSLPGPHTVLLTVENTGTWRARDPPGTCLWLGPGCLTPATWSLPTGPGGSGGEWEAGLGLAGGQCCSPSSAPRAWTSRNALRMRLTMKLAALVATAHFPTLSPRPSRAASLGWLSSAPLWQGSPESCTPGRDTAPRASPG